MRIEYVANRSQRDVRDSVGEALIARKLARPVYQTRHAETEEGSAPEATEELAISPRTGKPKRQYKRRDMKAER